MAKEYHLGTPGSLCSACGKPLAEGEHIVATATFENNELVRTEYHPHCWVEPVDKPGGGNDELLGVWQTRIPKKKEKKKLLVDDDLLVNFFLRLEGQQQPERVNFRFVLALILLRKKILAYENSFQKEGRTIWRMRFKKGKQTHEVVDPGMDDEKISSVSDSLSEVMEGDFDH